MLQNRVLHLMDLLFFEERVHSTSISFSDEILFQNVSADAFTRHTNANPFMPSEPFYLSLDFK